ncbi:MAG: RNA polymerase sigma factor [Verrucomicrobiota bacterium]
MADESPPPAEPTPPRDFASLYKATIAPLRRYLTRLLGNTSEAQDIAHDAYLRVYPNPDKPAPHHDQPEAVLYTTARRLAINRLKRRSISPITSDATGLETAASANPGVAQQVMARQELRLLEAAIAELPEGCRTVLLLRKVELLSHREIADRLGIAISTVEKQHVRALRLLRAALPAETARNRTQAAAPDSSAAKASS